MHLYALTLQKASSINHAILGNFSGSKQQEIVISRGKIIEILRPDPNTGKVFPLLAMEMFGVIRDLIAFKLTGGSKGTVVIDNFGLALNVCSTQCIIYGMHLFQTPLVYLVS